MVEFATKRVAARGLSDRISTRQADAQSLTALKVRHVACACRYSGLARSLASSRATSGGIGEQCGLACHLYRHAGLHVIR